MRLLCLLVLCIPSLLCGDELRYDRSFKLPKIQGRQFTFSGSKGPLCINPRNGNLVIRGHQNYNDVCEVAVPDADGATATLVGPWTNPTRGIDAAENARTGSQFRLRGMVLTDEGFRRCCLSRWYAVDNVNMPAFFTEDAVRKRSFGPWYGDQTSLKLGGYLCRLSPELETHFGKRYGGAETIPQGSAGSHRGPAFSVFDWPADATVAYARGIKSTYVGGFTPESPYPGWFQSWEIHAVCSLPNSVIWLGRRGFTELTDIKPNLKPGTAFPVQYPETYYGEAKTTFYRQDGTAVEVVDEANPAKGYHSDEYRPSCWMLSNAAIKAGRFSARDFTEITLADCVGRTKLISGTYDPRRQQLFVLDAHADENRPVVRVYHVIGESP